MNERLQGTRARLSLRASSGVLAVAVLVAAGCGGSSSSDEPTIASQTSPSSSAKTGQASSPGGSKSASTGQPQRKISSAPVRATIVHFGTKASAAEQAAAANAVQTFYTARAEEDWHTACPLLSPGMRFGVKQIGGRGDAGCGRGIESLTAASTLQAGEVTLAHVASLRRSRIRAFLVYTSGRGSEFGLLIKHIDGDWKIEGLNPTPIG